MEIEMFSRFTRMFFKMCNLERSLLHTGILHGFRRRQHDAIAFDYDDVL